jgi:hypothetical protein
VSACHIASSHARLVSSVCLVAALAIASCSSPQAGAKVGPTDARPREPTAHMARPEGAAPPSQRDATIAARPEPRCIPSAGNSQKDTTRWKLPKGAPKTTSQSSSCSLVAECIEARGRSMPGDGDLSIDCKGKACVCRFEAHEPNVRPTTLRFKNDDPCGGDHIEALLLDTCMKLVPERRGPDAGR